LWVALIWGSLAQFAKFAQSRWLSGADLGLPVGFGGCSKPVKANKVLAGPKIEIEIDSEPAERTTSNESPVVRVGLFSLGSSGPAAQDQARTKRQR